MDLTFKKVDAESLAVLQQALAEDPSLPINLRQLPKEVNWHGNATFGLDADGNLQGFIGTNYLWTNQRTNQATTTSFENGVLLGGEQAWQLFHGVRDQVGFSKDPLLADAGINPALPPLFGLPDGKIHNMADLQKLPVVTFLLGIGDRAQPSYHADDAKGNDRLHFYVQDSWKMTPRFTLNYGLGWEHESNNLNYDLDRPQLLAPLYGSDLSPTKKEYKNFAPAAGFAYSRGDQHPTVFRGGAGLFYDTQLGWWRLGERAVLGGSGRQFIGNAAVTNPLTGQPFSTAYLNSLALNYGTFLQMLPTLRAQQEAKYPGTGDQPQILLSKQATALGALYPQEFPTARALHLNAGVQQQLSNEMAVQAARVPFAAGSCSVGSRTTP